MRITKLFGRNVGPFHGDFSYTFRSGSIGIFGRNGSGKTTLVRLMQSALTGRFDMFPGNKEKLVNDLMEDGDKSFFAVECEHDNAEFSIRRNLNGSVAQRMVIAGRDQPILKQDEIREALAEMGITAKALDVFVFKEKVAEFIDMPPGKRAEMYKTLCATEDCTAAYDALHAMLTKDRDLTTEVVDNSDDLRQTIAGCDNQIKEIEVSIAFHRKKLLNAEDMKKMKTRLKKYQFWTAAVNRLSSLDDKISSFVDQIRAKTITIEEDSKEVVRLSGVALELSERVGSAQAEVLAAKANEKLYKRYTQLCTRKKELAAIKVEHPGDPPEEDEEETARQCAALVMKSQSLSSIINHWMDGEDDHSDCPTCGNEIADVPSFVALKTEELERVKTDFEVVSKVAKRWDVYRSKSHHYKLTKKSVDDEKKQVEAELKELGTIEEAEDVSDLEELINRSKSATRSFNNRKAELDIVTQEVNVLQAKLDMAREEHEKQTVLRTENAVSEARRTEATDKIGAHEDAELELARLDGRMETVSQHRGEAKRSLEKLEFRVRKSKRVKELRELLEKARDVMHWNGLPKMVAGGNMKLIETSLNRMLANFGEPFEVETCVDDMSFMVRFPGQTPRDMSWLSSGQRVVLATNFWPAVGSIFEKNLGILIMDEPTANLDAENVALMGDALMKMTQSVRDKRQVIMVTHSDCLRSSFDQVIELGV